METTICTEPVAHAYASVFDAEREMRRALVEAEPMAYRAHASVPWNKKSPQYEDPISWWRNNEAKYPNIAKVAKKYLGIPASSAPSERVFSRAAIILKRQMARLPHTDWNTACLFSTTSSYLMIESGFDYTCTDVYRWEAHASSLCQSACV